MNKKLIILTLLATFAASFAPEARAVMYRLGQGSCSDYKDPDGNAYDTTSCFSQKQMVVIKTGSFAAGPAGITLRKGGTDAPGTSQTIVKCMHTQCEENPYITCARLIDCDTAYHQCPVCPNYNGSTGGSTGGSSGYTTGGSSGGSTGYTTGG
jgi:uncharacterized membrane protein YgcG